MKRPKLFQYMQLDGTRVVVEWRKNGLAIFTNMEDLESDDVSELDTNGDDTPVSLHEAEDELYDDGRPRGDA